MLLASSSKSLPYMAGVSDCCFLFDFFNDDTFFNLDAEHQPLFMAKILNSTVLEGDDHITFYEGEFGRMVVSFLARLSSSRWLETNGHVIIGE